MKKRRPTGRLSSPLWKIWSRHVTLSICLAILSTALQVLIHPSVTKNYLTFFNSLRNKNFDGIFIRSEIIRDQWFYDDQGGIVGISLNRIVLANKSSIRSLKRFEVSGQPWEISVRWDEGYQRRPFRAEDFDLSASTFSLIFSESDRGPYHFNLDQYDPDECGFSLPGRDEEAAPGKCTPSCRAVIQSGPHTLTLRGEGNSLAALVDGSPCAFRVISEPIETLIVELSTSAGSCVSFDDLMVRVKRSGAEWTTLLEERFEVIPLQTGWLDSRFDLDSRRFRVAITWAAMAAALLIDLVALVLFGRRASALLVVAVPQACAILSLQSILLIPYVPLFFSVGSVWASKALLSLFGRVSIEQVSRLVLWFILCPIQALHWLWFRKIWTFVNCEVVILASLIPALLLVGLFIGAIKKRSWIRVSGRILIAALLAVCIELTLRFTPMQYHLDFKWRTANRFWDLQKHTNLIIDHSNEEFFEDTGRFVYSRKKPEGVFRLVCLGSSSTVNAMGLSDPIDSYPSQLRLLLERCSPGQVEVINAGLGGYRLTQLRVYLEHIILDLDPDLVILYFGVNGDSPLDMNYFRRVESLLEANPTLLYPIEVEAALSLRWPHPALIRAYLLLTKSRLFTGIKLMIDAVYPVDNEHPWALVYKKFRVKSADHLVRVVIKKGAKILLIPELSYFWGSYYKSIFEQLMRKHAGDQVYMLRIEGFDVSSYIVDDVHMNVSGCRELARVIADYLIGSGLIECNPREPKADW